MGKKSKQKSDFSEFQIGALLARLHKLIASGLLQNPENVKQVFYQSVFMECIIEMNYLVKTVELRGIVQEINFKDDIPPNKPYNDIIGLIEFLRHTICHAEDDGKRTIKKTSQYLAYTVRTKEDFDYERGDESYKQCPYEDEIAIVFGEHQIYINRHLVRLYKELSERAFKLKDFEIYKRFT